MKTLERIQLMRGALRVSAASSLARSDDTVNEGRRAAQVAHALVVPAEAVALHCIHNGNVADTSDLAMESPHEASHQPHRG